jgi:hypothetical protein
MTTVIGWGEETNLEKARSDFKMILEAAKVVCRSICCGGRRKQMTRWWNEDLRSEVRKKKEKWGNT